MSEDKRTPIKPLKLFIGLAIARRPDGQSHLQPTAFIAPSVDVARNQAVQAMSAAYPECACDTDAFEELPESLLGILVPPRASEWLLRMTRYGGAVVSSAMLSVDEIEAARTENRFWVDEEGFGYAYVPPVVNISPIEIKEGEGIAVAPLQAQDPVIGLVVNEPLPITLPAGPTDEPPFGKAKAEHKGH